MPSVSHPPLTFTWNLATGISASDLLHCSSNGVVGVPLKSLGRAQFGATTRDFALSAKNRKGKKHEDPIPWSNLDPNDDGEILRAISPFKPLEEEQKPVILDFEKPLVNLQKKIMEVHPLEKYNLVLSWQVTTCRGSPWNGNSVWCRYRRWRMKLVWILLVKLSCLKKSTNRFDIAACPIPHISLEFEALCFDIFPLVI